MESLEGLENSPRDPEQDFRDSREESWARFIGDRGRRYADCRLGTFDVEIPPCEPEDFDAYEERAKIVQDLQTIDYPKFFREGVSFLWLGSKGTGKDHLMVGALFCLIAKTRIAAEKWGYPTIRAVRVKWTSGVTLFGDRRDAMDLDQTEAEFCAPYIHADLLAISDPLPPTGTLTDFQQQTLYRIIDGRYNACRPTWATINVANRQELDERMGPQIADRLCDEAVDLPCYWPSYRIQ